MQTIVMTLGELSGKTYPPIIRAGIEAIEQGLTQYSPVEGIYELREAIAAHYAPNQATIGPQNVLVTAGVRQAVFNVLTNILGTNDEVILPAPYWFAFPSLIERAGGKLVTLPTHAADNYTLHPKQLEKLITPNTRLFIFNNPCNPSGRVYNEAEIDAIVAVLEKNPHVYVLSDEIYEYINYSKDFRSLETWQSIADRLITVSGFSKAFSMSGWRVGYIVAAENLIMTFREYQQVTLSGVSIFSQKAALEALRQRDNYLPPLLSELNEKIELATELMNTIPNIACPKPQGAYYLFPDVSAYFGMVSPKGRNVDSAASMVAYLYIEAGVQVFAGDMFGEPRCLRISLVLDKDLMLEGLNRIKNGLLELKSKEIA